MIEFTDKYLNECFSYDPESGVLSWIDRPLSHFKNSHSRQVFITRCSGKRVGSIKLGDSGKRYWIMHYHGRMLRVHRMIWRIVTGKFPKDQIDHINGDGIDNRWENLREVTHFENCRNVKMMPSNKSGMSGVSETKNGSWRVEIGNKGESVKFGRFKDKFEAFCARKSAENKYGYHPNHGKCRNL